jgi:L-aminopeptidase/D-esterase-like protein
LVDCGRHGSFTVGILVQSNYGSRDALRIAGVPVGEELADSFLPSSPPVQPNPAVAHAQGSIIVYVATDAPLLPHQLSRMAKRPALGLGRMGSIASDGARNAFFEPFIYMKRSFYQDRLGTNIGKTQKKSGVFRRER